MKPELTGYGFQSTECREIDDIKSWYCSTTPDFQTVININRPLASFLHRQSPRFSENPTDLIGLPTEKILDPEMFELFRVASSKLTAEFPDAEIEIPYFDNTTDETRYTGWSMTAKTNPETSQVERIVILGTDITEKISARAENIRLREELTQTANRDVLTGLYNRRFFEGQKLVLAHSRTPVAVGFFDLDFFKAINDSQGHSVGDEHLQDFVCFLRQQFRSGDVLARFGGDEFVVILTSPSLDQANLEQKYTDITKATTIINLDRQGQHIQKPEIRFSMGFALAEQVGGQWNIDAAQEQADQIMYQNKNLCRQRIKNLFIAG